MRSFQNVFASAAPLVLLPVVLGFRFPDCANGPDLLTSNLVCNTSASPSDRAAAIVTAMHTSEKLKNLVDSSKGVKRLGLPPYEWWNEALHGVALSPGVNFSASGDYSHATSFAEPILISASFDDKLVSEIAKVISTEARAFSNVGRASLDFWTPNINPYKDPRWGRGMETPGEDPFRIKQYLKQLLGNLEERTDNGHRKVIATCKHFAAYDLESWEGVIRHAFDAQVSTQDMVEYYLPPFQQCARDSQVGSIMCSYNAVNGVPSCANKYLLQTILRDHWSWTGDNQYIVSDCGAIDDISSRQGHHYVNTKPEASGLALTVGTDNICLVGPRPDVQGAYDDGYLSNDTMTTSLERQYEGLVRVGYFDPADSNPYRSISWSDVNTPHAQALATQSARDGLVLKKNDGTLPLQRTNYKLAMIGMWANATEQMLGNYYGVPPYIRSPLYAAAQLGFQTHYAWGPIDQKNDNYTKAALDAVSKSDVILYFGGIDTSIESEGNDRISLAWPDAQQQLLSKICAQGKPCIVVQMGDQLDDTPLLTNANISSFMWAGYPGQDGGPAVFDVLTGAAAPAGRLPVTVYPANYTKAVPMTDMSLRPSDTSPGRTYQFYPTPILPFGYGMHYTNFSLSVGSDAPANCSTIAIADLLSACNEAHKDLCAGPTVPVTVENKGDVKSDFVALAFVAGEFGPQPYPIKRLASYTRLRGVNAGEKQSAELAIELGSLARVDDNGHTVLYPGDYQILLDVPTQAVWAFTLTGHETVLDKWPAAPDSWA